MSVSPNRADRHETGQEHAGDGSEAVQGIERADMAGEVQAPAASEGTQSREGGTHQGSRQQQEQGRDRDLRGAQEGAGFAAPRVKDSVDRQESAGQAERQDGRAPDPQLQHAVQEQGTADAVSVPPDQQAAQAEPAHERRQHDGSRRDRVPQDAALASEPRPLHTSGR